MTKFCVDCKWIKREFLGTEYAECLCPETQWEPSLVSKKSITTFCSNQRGRGKCGKEGKFWEPAEPKRRWWHGIKVGTSFSGM